MDLSTLVMYDVQYVAAAYGSKINRIFIFAYYRFVISLLNALVRMLFTARAKKNWGLFN
jgi:hypothetical protein